MVTVQQNYLLI